MPTTHVVLVHVNLITVQANATCVFLRTIIEGEKKMKNKKPILVLIFAAFAAFLATFN